MAPIGFMLKKKPLRRSWNVSRKMEIESSEARLASALLELATIFLASLS